MAKAKNPASAFYQVSYYYSVNLPSVTFNPLSDTVKSVTTHVFYVNQDVTTSFEEALAKIGTAVEVPKAASSSRSAEPKAGVQEP